MSQPEAITLFLAGWTLAALAAGFSLRPVVDQWKSNRSHPYRFTWVCSGCGCEVNVKVNEVDLMGYAEGQLQAMHAGCR